MRGVTAGSDSAKAGAVHWRFEKAFLQSNWTCIWGRGCLGILDEPAPDERLEPDADCACGIGEVVRAAVIPGIDLLGEHRERGVGIDVDLDRDAYIRRRRHRRFSAWALKWPSCSDQKA